MGAGGGRVVLGGGLGRLVAGTLGCSGGGTMTLGCSGGGSTVTGAALKAKTSESSELTFRDPKEPDHKCCRCNFLGSTFENFCRSLGCYTLNTHWFNYQDFDGCYHQHFLESRPKSNIQTDLPGTHFLMSLARTMLSGQAQVYFGEYLDT